MKLSIIIPVFDNWNYTRALLKDLAQLPLDHEVIIVDNGSRDDTHKSCALWASDGLCATILHNNHPTTPGKDRPWNLRCIQNKENKGFAKACNQGYEIAKGKHILFLNNDVRVTKDYDTWTEDLINAAVPGSLVGPNGGLLDEYFNFVRETTTIEPGNFYMSGWCLCAQKETFDKLLVEGNEFKGPFSEEFGIAYFEDTDLGIRASEASLVFKIVPVSLVHFGKCTSKKIGISQLYQTAKVIFVNKWTKRRAGKC